MLNVSGVLTFGPADASGTFEVMGSAPSASAKMMPWDLGTPVTSIYWTFILEYTSDSKGSYRTHIS